jgi:hypothetical protein
MTSEVYDAVTNHCEQTGEQDIFQAWLCIVVGSARPRSPRKQFPRNVRRCVAYHGLICSALSTISTTFHPSSRTVNGISMRTTNMTEWSKTETNLLRLFLLRIPWFETSSAFSYDCSANQRRDEVFATALTDETRKSVKIHSTGPDLTKSVMNVTSTHNDREIYEITELTHCGKHLGTGTYLKHQSMCHYHW